MFIPKLNSKCVLKYSFDGGKKIVARRMLCKKQNCTFLLCLATADSISISVLPTNCSKKQKCSCK